MPVHAKSVQRTPHSSLPYQALGGQCVNGVQKMAQRFHVRAQWDPEVGVWWAESDDIPGLVTEASTLEGLIERVRTIAPELLALNGIEMDGATLPLHVTAERDEDVALAS
jgi:predicted RNase H-like HicB family nuclease